MTCRLRPGKSCSLRVAVAIEVSPRLPLRRGDFDDVPDLLGDVAGNLLADRRGLGYFDRRERQDCADTGVATDRPGSGASRRYHPDSVVGVRRPVDGGRCSDGVGADAAQGPYADRFSLEKGHQNCLGLLPETPCRVSNIQSRASVISGQRQYDVDSNFEKKFFENEVFLHHRLIDSSSVFRGSDGSQ